MLKNLIPPFLYSAYVESRKKYGYFGEYKNWNEARAKSSGYDSSEIIEKVKNSALKVKRGEAAYERDSVLFSKTEANWNMLGPLLLIASENKNSLSVLDFGGSLGTSYYQNSPFMSHVDLKWTIIEQPKFVEYGKKYFEDETLKFFDNPDEYKNKPDVVILSSSLQYLETPYQTLEKIVSTGVKYILINKTPFSEKTYDIVTVQKIPSHIYEASYPSWIFSLNKFFDFMASKKYRLLSEIGSRKDSLLTLKSTDVVWKDLLFEKK